MSEPKIKLSSYLPWVVVGVLAYLLWQNRTGTDGERPTPEPTEQTAAEAAAEMLERTANGYAAAFADAADGVELGEIASDADLLEFLQQRTRDARIDARRNFDIAFESEMPDGEFSDDIRPQVTRKLNAIAEAFR